MFATGIENSIPTIDHGKTRIDEMEVCGHYERWREDFDCVQEIGINFLRYGPPIHKTYLGPGKFDWEYRPDLPCALAPPASSRRLWRTIIPRHMQSLLWLRLLPSGIISSGMPQRRP